MVKPSITEFQQLPPSYGCAFVDEEIDPRILQEVSSELQNSI